MAFPIVYDCDNLVALSDVCAHELFLSVSVDFSLAL